METTSMASVGSPAPAALDPQRQAAAVRKVRSALGQAIRANKIPSNSLVSPKSIAPRATTGPFTKISLVFIEMKANQITREVGENGDEMALAGVALGGRSLETKIIGPFKVVGRFTKDGEVKPFEPGLVMATFDTDSSFPQSYGAVMQMVERDGHDTEQKIPGLLQEAVKQLKQELVPAAPATQAASSDGQGGSAVAEILVKLTKEVVGDELGEDLLNIVVGRDELFPPGTVKATLQSATDLFGGGATSLVQTVVSKRSGGFFRTGEYTTKFKWLLHT